MQTNNAQQNADVTIPNVPIPSKFWIHVWYRIQYGSESAYGWSVFQGYRDSEITVRMNGWYKDYDSQYTDDSGYAIKEIQGEFAPDQTKLITLIEKGKRINIPIIGVKNIGTKDGSPNGVVFEAPNRRFSTIEWWSSGPKEWQELVTWHRELTDFLKLADVK